MHDPKRPLYTVSELNLKAKAALEKEPDLSFVSVRGEIASYKEYPSAVYFDIKDDKSILSCVMWGRDTLSLSWKPKVGEEVVAFGSVALYPAKGRYQFQCLSLSLFGQGDALLELQKRKEKLEKEGLFDPARKRKLPAFPQTIGLIVGDGSAAEADLLRNLNRRWPLSAIVVFPSLVQGKNAPKEIIKALERANAEDLDVLILARGGGSNDDLDAWNDEDLVRAVAKSKAPTIAAVGHEIDFTLVDYVADKRVSTPTGAAELATPDQNDVYQGLIETENALNYRVATLLRRLEERLENLSNRPFFVRPEALYERGEREVEALAGRLDYAYQNAINRKETSLKQAEASLDALNPSHVLERGYSIARDENGAVISSAKAVKPGMKVKTILKDGSFTSKVEGE